MKSLKPKNVLIDNVAIRRRIAGEHDIELTREERRRMGLAAIPDPERHAIYGLPRHDRPRERATA